jgi:hypothetical protein
MPTEVKGVVELLKASKEFAPDLLKQYQTEVGNALSTVVIKARGFIPANASLLSGWSKPISSESINYRAFPKFDSGEAKRKIGYKTTPTRANRSGWSYLARIVNASAAGAIYETSGRKNPQGRPAFQRMKLVYRTSGSEYPGADFQLNYHKGNAIGSKQYSNSNNPKAGKQFIDSLNSTSNLVNARPKGIVGNPGRKSTGRAIFRAWAEDEGKANAAVMKAIEKAAANFEKKGFVFRKGSK